MYAELVLKSATKNSKNKAMWHVHAIQRAEMMKQGFLTYFFSHLGSSFVDNKSLTRGFERFPNCIAYSTNQPRNYKPPIHFGTFSPKNSERCNYPSNKDTAGVVVENYPKAAAKKLCFQFQRYFTSLSNALDCFNGGTGGLKQGSFVHATT